MHQNTILRLIAQEATEHWRTAAACQSADPELFFPVSVTGPSVEQVAAAKEICGPCLVRSECLSFAQRTGTLHGIWGGLTEQERTRRRHRAMAVVPAEPAKPVRQTACQTA
jgi:WhiB family transcriptional regulator, redox-sensing transcriptional regulator